MRKIHVVVLDTFGTEAEAAVFRVETVSRLRFEHHDSVIQVDLAGSLRESVVLHAYGFGDDKAWAEESAGRTVGEMLSVLAKDPPPAAGSREIPSDEVPDLSTTAAENCVKTHCSDIA